MRKAVEVRRTIAIPADMAWAVIRTGQDVDLWFPAITACRRDGDRRFCTMAGGGELVETITATNEDDRRFGYRVDSHPLPVGPVDASMQVIDQGAGSCEIIWRATFEGDEANAAQVSGMLEGLYAQGIEGLATYAAKAA